MNPALRQLPEPARSIAGAAADAVSAARTEDRAAYDEASGRLAGLDGEQVGIVLGTVVRSLLEDLHPDGLAGEDVQAALERCVRSSATWYPVDLDVLVVLLTGALGIHQEERVLTPHEQATHAPLLVADLLGHRPLDGYLAAAFAEIARGEIMEMP